MTFPQDLLEKVKEHLLAEKRKIEETLLSLRSQDPYSDPDRLNDNAASDTEAKEESSHERMEALEKELKLHLSEVDETLKRVESNTYGNCLSCQELIDTDRLSIKPTALYCVVCEKKRSS